MYLFALLDIADFSQNLGAAQLLKPLHRVTDVVSVSCGNHDIRTPCDQGLCYGEPDSFRASCDDCYFVLKFQRVSSSLSYLILGICVVGLSYIISRESYSGEIEVEF